MLLNPLNGFHVVVVILRRWVSASSCVTPQFFGFQFRLYHDRLPLPLHIYCGHPASVLEYANWGGVIIC